MSSAASVSSAHALLLSHLVFLSFFSFAEKFRERIKLQLTACIYCLSPHPARQDCVHSIPMPNVSPGLIAVSKAGSGRGKLGRKKARKAIFKKEVATYKN